MVGLRETLNNNSKITTGVTISIIVVVLGYIIYASTGHGPGAAPVLNRAFYTVDDGATWFTDDINKIPPFDHDGKQAVRAHLYRCDGKTFVNHMERYTAEAHKRLQQQASGPSSGSADAPSADAGGSEVKSPGEEKWVSANDPAAAKIIQPKCKDGKPELVLP